MARTRRPASSIFKACGFISDGINATAKARAFAEDGNQILPEHEYFEYPLPNAEKRRPLFTNIADIMALLFFQRAVAGGNAGSSYCGCRFQDTAERRRQHWLINGVDDLLALTAAQCHPPSDNVCYLDKHLRIFVSGADRPGCSIQPAAAPVLPSASRAVWSASLKVSTASRGKVIRRFPPSVLPHIQTTPGKRAAVAPTR